MVRRISLVAVWRSRCLAELVGACFQSLEQAHVVDGDHRLVREGRDERNVALVERAGPRAGTSQMTPTHSSFLIIGHEERGANALDVRAERQSDGAGRRDSGRSSVTSAS